MDLTSALDHGGKFAVVEFAQSFFRAAAAPVGLYIPPGGRGVFAAALSAF